MYIYGHGIILNNIPLPLCTVATTVRDDIVFRDRRSGYLALFRVFFENQTGVKSWRGARQKPANINVTLSPVPNLISRPESSRFFTQKLYRRKFFFNVKACVATHGTCGATYFTDYYKTNDKCVGNQITRSLIIFIKN